MPGQVLLQLPLELWAKVLDHCRPRRASTEAGVTLLAHTATLVDEQQAFFALRQVSGGVARLLLPAFADLVIV